MHTCRFFLPTNSAQYQSARSLESINVKKVSKGERVGEGQAGCTFFSFFFANILFLSSKHALMMEEQLVTYHTS